MLVQISGCNLHSHPHQYGSILLDIQTVFSIDTTWGTNENTAVAIPRKTEHRLTRCGPAERVSTTSSGGRPNSKFLSAIMRR